jgi:hypothetical protein
MVPKTSCANWSEHTEGGRPESGVERNHLESEHGDLHRQVETRYQAVAAGFA